MYEIQFSLRWQTVYANKQAINRTPLFISQKTLSNDITAAAAATDDDDDDAADTIVLIFLLKL